MSLVDDEMIDRLSSTLNNGPSKDLSAEEKELASLQSQKHQLMVEQSKQYLEQLFAENTSQPVKIKNVQLTNGQNYRDGFVAAQFEPLLRHGTSAVSLQTLFADIDTISKSFVKLNVVQDIMVSVNQLPRPIFSRTTSPCLDIVPVFNVLPVKRFYAKTGTNIGSGEGDGYIQFSFRNLFGGGENLTMDAISGTKTSSSYLVNYNQPVFNQANYIWENVAYVNTRKYDWIGADVISRGLTSKVYTQYDTNINHELTLENSWRVLNNVSSKAPDLLAQSGSNFKSALAYSVRYDTRNNSILPSAGKFIRLGLELNGLVPKWTSSPFFKTTVESQAAVAVPWLKSSLVFSNRAGVLYSWDRSSFILDRFFTGGPNDVRSFTMNGLGPKSHGTSLGGDAFVSGGVSLVSKIPGVSADSNFKLHNFVNYGRLVPLAALSNRSLLRSYSVSYGFGLLFNHPMARFELNFVLPLAVHERDGVRKGFQYGIGVSFL